MHDRMFVRWMTAVNETGVAEIRATLGWVIHPLTPEPPKITPTLTT